AGRDEGGVARVEGREGEVRAVALDEDGAVRRVLEGAAVRIREGDALEDHRVAPRAAARVVRDGARLGVHREADVAARDDAVLEAERREPPAGVAHALVLLDGGGG